MRRVWMLVLALVLAGCGQPPDLRHPVWSATVSPAGTEYVLSEATVGGRPHELVADTTVSLEFTDDGELRANAGCNHLRWRVSFDDGTLSTEGGEQTGIGCDQRAHARDTWLTEFLGSGPSWERDGPELVLRGGDTELVFTDREVAEPDRPLVGPVWTVDTLVDGQVASSTPNGAAATVEFGDSQLTVFAGCNGGSSAYTVTGDTIEVDALVLTRKACAPDIMRLEEAVVAVLDGAVTYAVSAEVLTLEHPSGKGLRLRAE